MTVTPVLLTEGGDSTAGTVFSTASIAPGPTRVLYVAILASAPSGGNTGTPTLSADVGQTWELTLQSPSPAAVRTLYVFRTTTTANPSSGPLTFDFGAQTINSAVWAVYEVDGADLTSPTVQSIEQRLTGNANTSCNFAFPSPVDPANGALAFVGLNQEDEITAGSGWTDNATATISGPPNSLLPMHASSAPQNVAASWTVLTNTWVIAVEVKAEGSTPTGPALLSRWVGAVTTTEATVAVKTSDTTSARLVVATDSALSTGVVFGSAATPDTDGYAKLPVTGLTAGTTYFYGVELDGAVDAARGSFRTFPTGAASFSFGFGSCTHDVDSDSFGRMQARDPDLFVHLGDFRYLNPFTNDPSLFRGMYDEALSAGYESALYANTPTAYTWSDHDYAGGSNAWSAAVSKPAAQSTYRQVVPHYPLPDAEGIYQTFTYGRVRFIATDLRSFRSDPASVDDASKTMMGAVQKQWWKDTITAATEAVIVWSNEVPWICDATEPDTWGGYTTEQAELVAFVQASGKRVVIISGDMHALAADDGTNSPGGLPVFQAAPFVNDTATKPGTYSAGVPYTEAGTGRFYGWMDVTDDGSTVTLDFTGYGTDDTAKVTQTVVVAPDVPTGSASGTHTWTGTSAGSAVHQGSSSGTHTWTASAAGSAVHQGSSSGPHDWTGAASGSTAHQGTASGGHTWSGTASGTAPAVDAASGSASGSHTWTGTAAGTVQHQGATSGTHGWAGTPSGSTQHQGSTAGSHTWTGTASGVAPVVGANSGSAQGSHTWTGSASGSVEHRGAAEGSWAVAGSASGTTEHSGSAAGGHTWTGTASGSTPAEAAASGSASGSHTWTGTASGTAVRAGAASGTHTWTGTASGGQPIGSPVDICITWGPLRTRNTDTTLRVHELDTQVGTRSLTAALEVRELDTQVATRTLATTLEEC